MENLFDFNLVASKFNGSNQDQELMFDVINFEGEEKVSSLYKFSILLAVHNVLNIDELVNRLLKERVALTINDHHNNIKNICGVCEKVSIVAFKKDLVYIQVDLVPAISVLKHDARARIFLNKSIPEIINQVLLEETKKFGLIPFNIKLLNAGAYPKEELVSQFNESNWDFLNRLMEKVGIYYFFEQPIGELDNPLACSEVLQIIDNLMFEQFIEEKDFKFTHDDLEDPQVVHDFKISYQKQCATTIQRGYDWDTSRSQKVKPQASAQAPFSNSSNKHFESVSNTTIEQYDSSYLSSNVHFYANIIAQRHVAHAETAIGNSSNAGISCGKIFTMLSNEYLDEKNWFVIGLKHKGVQANYMVAGFDQESSDQSYYQNDLYAIPSDVQYRAALKTPIPKFYGVIPGVVEGADGSDKAFLDDLGRYKIKLPYDEISRASGQSSCWVKLMSPYGGVDATTGFHFPLLKDAQVLIGFIEGNIDRPYIVGAIQDSSGSIVNSSNSYCNMIRTPAGNLMVLGDLPKDQYFYLIKNNYGYRTLGNPPSDLLSKY